MTEQSEYTGLVGEFGGECVSYSSFLKVRLVNMCADVNTSIHNNYTIFSQWIIYDLVIKLLIPQLS